MASSKLLRRVDYEAEVEVEKGAGYQNPRPQILNMDGFTEQAADAANPTDYRLIDLLRTLIYLQEGVNSVKKVFEQSEVQYEWSRFNNYGSSDSGSSQKRNLWRLSTIDQPVHNSNVVVKQIKVAVWAQIDMRRQIDLEDDSESWTVENEEVRPWAEVILNRSIDSVYEPIGCSLLPSTIASTEKGQIDVVTKAINMMLLHEIAAFKEGRKFDALVTGGCDESQQLEPSATGAQQSMQQPAPKKIRPPPGMSRRGKRAWARLDLGRV